MTDKPNFKQVFIKYDDNGKRCWLENEEGVIICNFYFNQSPFENADANIKEIAYRVNNHINKLVD